MLNKNSRIKRFKEISRKANALHKDAFLTPFRSGFTLIELLVVVLIIGILASIALPQYQKAVAKSRLAQLDTMIDAAKKNIELYVLANGTPSSTVFLTGINSESSYDMPGDCSEGRICKTDHWKLLVAFSSGDPVINVASANGSIAEGISFALHKSSNTDTWYVVPANGSNLDKVTCQWLRERGYPGLSTLVQLCQSHGVTLSTYGS